MIDDVFWLNTITAINAFEHWPNTKWKSKHFTCIVEFTTVIWSWEQRYQLSLGKEFISIFYNLMSSAYQIEIVFLKEFIYNLCFLLGNSKMSTWALVEWIDFHRFEWIALILHTSAPNVKLTPRSFSPHPIVSLSGSDHNKSHSKPWSGTSVGRIIRRICSIEARSGLSPPWHVKIFSSTEKSMKIYQVAKV